MNADAVLLDIEGTVAPIAFVKDVLFPLSAAELPRWLTDHRRDPDVAARIEEVGPDLPGAIETLLHWIATDRKHPALKALQGQIWREAFEQGKLAPPFYPDVAPALRAWRASGKRLAVYSSGSVEAQQLFYRYAEGGRLDELIDAWFDLGAGSKQDSGSYVRIALSLRLAPQQVLFLTDVWTEVQAARAAGMQAVVVKRPGNADLPEGVESVGGFGGL